MTRKKYFLLCCITLVVNILVILWGAFVRASHSGAGCGRSWPLCQGSLLPSSPTIATWIEFLHRATSGMALLLVLAMLFYSIRLYPKTHIVRFFALMATIFVFIEAGVGAALVLFELVTHNQSFTRAVVLSAHLINTFLLTSSIALTALFSRSDTLDKSAVKICAGTALSIGYFLLLIVGALGALTSLADTLYPARNLIDGMMSDFVDTSPAIVRMRIFHPVIAIVTACYLVFVGMMYSARANRIIRRGAKILLSLLVLQVLVGFTALVLLTPVWSQMLHLFLAHCLTITLAVLIGENARRGDPTWSPSNEITIDVRIK